MTAPHPQVSVVIPVFNEEASLPELHERLTKALASTGKSWELVYVDDGSADRSRQLLARFAEREPRVRVVEFGRNRGQHAAVFAGLAWTRGRIVVTLDADLQNPPEEVPRLAAKMEEGYDVVGTVRRNRRDPLYRRIASRLVNGLAGCVRPAARGMTDFGCMLRAYSRNVVDQICRHPAPPGFIPAIAMRYARSWTEVPVAHAARARGPSKYGLLRLVRLQMDLMAGLSRRGTGGRRA